MFQLIGLCKWFEVENIMEFIMNRDTIVKKTFESQIQSNMSATVTRKKWCGDRYIQGRHIQV